MARMKKTEAKRVPKQEWAAPLMTEKEKQVVRSLMDKRVQKLKAKYGKITMRHVKELVATRSLQMLLQESNRQPSDVAWAWVAEQQANCLLDAVPRAARALDVPDAPLHGGRKLPRLLGAHLTRPWPG